MASEPRRLTEQQIEIIAGALRNTKIQTVFPLDDFEVAQYKSDFEFAFSKAEGQGLEYNGAWPAIDDRPWYEVELFIPNQATLDDVLTQPILRAFNAAGLCTSPVKRKLQR